MSSIGSGDVSWQASFFQAAGKGDEHRIRELIQEGALHREKFKDTLRIALQKAAGRGNEPLTRLLLEEGAEVNVVSTAEAPALYKAAELGKDKIVHALLEYGADTETRDKFHRTAIFPAAHRNHRDTLGLLLRAGANVNLRDVDDQNLVLHLASEKPERPGKWGKEVIQILLDTNIDLEAKDKDGRTALLWAAATGKEALTELLLTGRSQNNAYVNATNSRGKTTLHLAAENNRINIVRFLLHHEAIVHARSDGGWTALHNAADKGHKHIASLLLKHNASINARTSSGMTALHWCARNGHIETVKLLLEYDGLKRDCKDSFDSTPMLGAAQNGHIEIVKLLSPVDDGRLLSPNAQGACKGFQATVVDFGMEKRPMNHNKHSVFDLLYGMDEKMQKPLVTTLVRNIPAKPAFRWIHLPTNNMSWVEALITKHFVENSASDVEGFKAVEKSFGQSHHGPTVHSHFMRPLCNRMQPTGRDPPVSDTTESATEKSGNDAEVPRIIFSNDENATLSDPITPDKKPRQGERKNKRNEKPSGTTLNGGTPKNASRNLRTEATPLGKRENRSSKRDTIPLGKKPRRTDRGGNIVLFMPYLHSETHQKRKKMSEAIERAKTSPRWACGINDTCDEMLIQAYLQSSHNFHIRRTLDQFYYHGISTVDRDTDQVVYRYTRDKGKVMKVFMVDQLWLWILDKHLIITSFPQRWEQPKNDPLNVLDGIIEDMNSKTRPPVKSVYDLAMLISGRCSGVFDRHRLGDEDFQFLDMFESSIGVVKFNDASEAAAQWLRNQRERGNSQIIDIPSNNGVNRDPTFVDTLLDIGEETALLAETKDIRDELNMISMVLKHQLSILEDLTHALCEELKGNHNQQKQAEIKKRFREQHKVVEVHLKDVERVDKQAEGINTSLTHLLDLKQKHANAFEARFARDQAAFTGRQGQTIMVFTIVTIIFLPMSFIAAFFAIPIRDFPQTDGSPSLTLSYVSKFMFGVGLAISIPLITVAFAVDNVGLLIRRAVGSVVSSGKRLVKRENVGAGGLDERPRTRSQDLGVGKRSGETWQVRASYDTDGESGFGASPVGFETGRGWTDEVGWRGGRWSRDVEKGDGVA